MSAFAVPFDLSFDAAVAYAKARGVVLAPVYYAMAAEKRAQAFTVSNLAKLDQVQAVADQLAKIHAQGGTFADFQRWAKTQDWSLPRHRLETIYRNAAQTAYMAGHWRSFEQSKDALPYLMWDAVNDSRTRPSHLALDGVIKPVSDVFWKSHNVPAGHRCRCSIRAIGREEAQRRGGITQNVPAEGGADKGWGHDPREWTSTLERVRAEKVAKAQPVLGEAVSKIAGMQTPAIKKATTAEISAFLAGAGGLPIVVAALPPDVRDSLSARTDAVLMSRYTADKQAKHPEITAESFSWLQELIDNGERIHDAKNHVIVIQYRDRPYLAVLKVTESGEYVFLQSFRRTDAKNIESLRKKSASGE